MKNEIQTLVATRIVSQINRHLAGEKTFAATSMRPNATDWLVGCAIEDDGRLTIYVKNPTGIVPQTAHDRVMGRSHTIAATIEFPAGGWFDLSEVSTKVLASAF